MPNPFASQCHTSARSKMGSVSGSPKNFESPADKAERFSMSSTDGMASLPSRKSRVNAFQEGGRSHGDAAADRKLINKVMKEKGCK